MRVSGIKLRLSVLVAGTFTVHIFSSALDGLSFSSQCYYLGATKDAATKILGEVTRPMSVHVPVVKICERLKKMDSQICELKYGTKDATVFPIMFRVHQALKHWATVSQSQH